MCDCHCNFTAPFIFFNLDITSSNLCSQINLDSIPRIKIHTKLRIRVQVPSAFHPCHHLITGVCRIINAAACLQITTKQDILYICNCFPYKLEAKSETDKQMQEKTCRVLTANFHKMLKGFPIFKTHLKVGS